MGAANCLTLYDRLMKAGALLPVYMKIAYCGFDFFSACLQQLLDHAMPVIRVFSFPADRYYVYNDYVEAICTHHQLPFSLSPVTPAMLQTLRDEGCELLLTAGYLHKIPPLPPGMKGVNIHPALLPQGRGRWPLPWVLLKGLSRTGVSFHELSPQWDGGPLLWQRPIEVSSHENLESLCCKTQMLAKEMIIPFIRDFDRYWAHKTEQTGGETWPLPGDAERTLRWDAGVTVIDRCARAFSKLGCYARFNDQDWIVFDATVWPQSVRELPGTVVHKTNTETVVAAADGYVCLRYFIRSGKR